MCRDDFNGRDVAVKRVRAGAYLHSRRGADSGEISLYVTPEEYWLFTSVPAERNLLQQNSPWRRPRPDKAGAYGSSRPRGRPLLVRVQQKVLSQSGRLERNAKVLPATFDKRDVSYKSRALKLDSEFAWMPEMEFSRRNQNGDKFFGS